MTMILLLLTLASAAVAVFGVPAIRRRLISTPIMRRAKRALPRLGDAERIALEAGGVWWDSEPFPGRPDWRKLLAFDVRP